MKLIQVIHNETGNRYLYECEVCGFTVMVHETDQYAVCPNCSEWAEEGWRRRIVEPTITECHRTNLCVDCDDEACSHHGDIGADCPKWKCDNDHDCEHCEWIKKYTKLMRGNKNGE